MDVFKSDTLHFSGATFLYNLSRTIVNYFAFWNTLMYFYCVSHIFICNVYNFKNRVSAACIFMLSHPTHTVCYRDVGVTILLVSQSVPSGLWIELFTQFWTVCSVSGLVFVLQRTVITVSDSTRHNVWSKHTAVVYKTKQDIVCWFSFYAFSIELANPLLLPLSPVCLPVSLLWY